MTQHCSVAEGGPELAKCSRQPSAYPREISDMGEEPLVAGLARAWQIADHMASCVNLSVTRYTPPRERRIASLDISRTVSGRRNERGRVGYDSTHRPTH
jgi:hypothetical protein